MDTVNDNDSGPRSGLRNRWPEIAAGVGLLLAWLPLQKLPLTHDIAWQFWIGRQISHGVGLYSQIFEVNPPLWFWMTVPILRVSQWAGASDFSGLVTFFVLALALSGALLAILVREQPARDRAYLYAALAVGTLLLALREFGQREQYVLITTIPYVALIARRAGGLAVSHALAIGVTAFAATGFALKPYFVAAPLFLEAWFFLAARPNWRPWRPEWFVLVLGAAAYGVAVLVWAQAYLTVTVPMTLLTYSAYDVPLRDLLGSELALPAALTLLGVLALGRLRSTLAAASLVAAAAFVLAFVWQGKVWFYHAIPATGLLLFFICAEVPRLRWPALSLREKIGLGLLGWAFFVPYFNSALLGFGAYHNRYRADVLALTADLKPGATVMPISARSTFIWPMAEARRWVWPSRYYSFLMLPAIAVDRKSGHPTPALARLARTIQADTLQDMLCYPPQRIIVHDTTTEQREREVFRNTGFDYLQFLSENPGIAELLTHYAPGPKGAWRTYDLVRPVTARPAEPCRRIY